MRDRSAQPASSGRGTGCSAARRRDARARARKPSAVNGELDGGALPHRRARAPASKPRWRRPAHSARPPWPAAVASVSWGEKMGRERMNPRVPGPPPVAGFVRATRAGGRRIHIRRRGGDAAVTGQFWPKRGAASGRFGGLAIGCCAEGPSVARAERAGPISCLGCFNSESFKLFFLFSRSILIAVFE